RFGKFLACSAFPKCKNTKPLDQDTGIACPNCGKGKIVAKKTKSRKTFYACDQYPKCKFALWARPSGNKCPKCGSLMINAGNNEEKCSNNDCE
ncbi:DNA topoisomerase I, partial [Candidatus Kuenenbacteria bacterium]|nr:DNA topoisomerase I [Candidatus Kuenenbacteria bacterium]